MSHTTNVLLLGDSANDADALTTHLQTESMQPILKRVQTVESLEPALASQAWDLVLISNPVSALPLETPIEIVRQWNNHVPLVVVTESLEVEAAIELMRAGASDIVLKEDLPRLRAVVKREVHKHRQLLKPQELERQPPATNKELVEDLKERIKELTALYNATARLRRIGLEQEEMLKEFLDIIPPAFTYPENVAVRIQFDGSEIQTPEFHETDRRLSSEFQIADGCIGTIDVFYVGKAPPPEQLAFLPEEKTLLNSLAELLGHYLDRKKAEEMLIESEQRHRLLIETIPHMVWMTDQKGRANYVNRRAEVHLGRNAETLLGWGWLESVHPEDREDTRDHWLECVSIGNPYTSEFRMRVPESDYRWYLAKAMPLRNSHRQIESWIGTWTDIDERKQSEAQLRRISDLLQAVSDNASDAIFVKDRQGRYLLFNAAAARFVDRSVEDVIGRDDRDLFNSADADWLMQRDRHIMESGIADTREERLTANGVTRTYLATKAPYRDANGDILGLVGISHDVTERKKAEEALRLSEERFRAFMDNSPAGCWIADLEGRFIYASASQSRTLGILQCNLVGHTVFELFPKHHAELYLHNNRKVVESEETLETIEPGVRADGTTGEFLVFRFPLWDCDKTPLVGGVAVDITAHRKLEETLVLRDRAINAAGQGLLIMDSNQPENPIIYASPGAERMTGYSIEEILGSNSPLLRIPENASEARDSLGNAMMRGEACTIEFLNARKDGARFWSQLSLSPVRDECGDLTHFVGVLDDVTERRHLKQQFQQAQKMEALGQLAGGIAHDFNNFLTIINGYAEALLEKISSDDPFRDPLQEISNAGKRSAKLTRQLLTFSHHQALTTEILDLNRIVSEAEQMLQPLLGETIELSTVLCSGRLPIKADAGQVEQLLLNLAVNARDSMPDGGQLIIETLDVELSPEYCRGHPHAKPGPAALLAVTDTGCGMSTAVKTRIFEPFFTTKKNQGGTGLGLSVVHGIVKHSGGHLDLTSDVGIGTTFKVFLPRLPLDLAANDDGPQIASSSLRKGNETILLIEDNLSVRSFTRQILENCGYTVLEAAGGQEADTLLKTYQKMFTCKIHLLLTDVVMPGESGPEIAKRFLKTHPDMRVIYVSGYTDDTVLHYGIRNSEVHFLQKPFTSMELATKVRAVLDGS